MQMNNLATLTATLKQPLHIHPKSNVYTEAIGRFDYTIEIGKVMPA
jgi:hypothetical protein